MNVPAPPVFLCETELGHFEVMDGQQRLNSIVEFLQNRFKLTRLKTWAVLNGRIYSELPPSIRRGLERAKISAITLMSDTSEATDNSLELRAQVFERLNTGGERLNPQEFVLADKAYDAEWIRAMIEAQDAVPIIPDRSTATTPHAFSRTLYRMRNRVERFFNKLKQFRRIATRYEKLAANYLAMIKIATIRIWLRFNESTA